MTATFTRSPGFGDYVSNSSTQIDYDVDNYLDYDDTGARWDISSFLMKKENSEKVDTPIFYTWEAEYTVRTGTTAEAVTTSETAVDVTSANGIRVGDILWFPTADAAGTYARVSAIATNTLTVAYLASTGGTIANGATYYVLNEAAAETASTSVAATYMYPTRVTNTVMIVRRAFEWSLTEEASALYTGNSVSNKEEQTRVEFQKDLAHLAWFSVADSTPTVTGVYVSKGIIPQLQTNAAALRINAGSDTLSYEDVVNLADGLIQFSNTNEYMVFCGSTALKGLAKLGASSSTYQSRPGDNSFGFSGTTVAVGDMKFMFKFERVFKEMGTPINNYAVALDLKQIKFAHLGDKNKFRFQPNVHDDPGGETRKSQFRAQVGVKLHWPKRHGYIFGLA